MMVDLLSSLRIHSTIHYY